MNKRQLRLGCEPIRSQGGYAGLDLLLNNRNPHHKKFVEIATKDR